MMTGSWHCPFSALNVKVIPRVKQWVAISEVSRHTRQDLRRDGFWRLQTQEHCVRWCVAFCASLKSFTRRVDSWEHISESTRCKRFRNKTVQNVEKMRRSVRWRKPFSALSGEASVDPSLGGEGLLHFRLSVASVVWTMLRPQETLRQCVVWKFNPNCLWLFVC